MPEARGALQSYGRRLFLEKATGGLGLPALCPHLGSFPGVLGTPDPKDGKRVGGLHPRSPKLGSELVHDLPRTVRAFRERFVLPLSEDAG